MSRAKFKGQENKIFMRLFSCILIKIPDLSTAKLLSCHSSMPDIFCCWFLSALCFLVLKFKPRFQVYKENLYCCTRSQPCHCDASSLSLSPPVPLTKTVISCFFLLCFLRASHLTLLDSRARFAFHPQNLPPFRFLQLIILHQKVPEPWIFQLLSRTPTQGNDLTIFSSAPLNLSCASTSFLMMHKDSDTSFWKLTEGQTFTQPLKLSC